VLEFELPWLFALLALPLVAWRLLPPYREPEEAIQAPFFDAVARALGRTPHPGAVEPRKGWAHHVLAPVLFALLVLAAAKPIWLEPPIVKKVAARDLMLAVDLSGSMEAEDFQDAGGKKVTRLQAVKAVVGDFIERREDDRIGLVVFGTAAYLQAPFTQDHDIVRFLLDETRVRMAGPQTMLGDAIGFAIPRFEESTSSNRVMLLLTDGNDTGSRMPPSKAAEIAADRGITIHTIAIGDPETVGEEALDEDALREIARTTHGQFFRANDHEELDAIYRELDTLEPGIFDTLSHRPRHALWPWALGAVLLTLLIFHGVRVGAALLDTRRRTRHA